MKVITLMPWKCSDGNHGFGFGIGVNYFCESWFPDDYAWGFFLALGIVTVVIEFGHRKEQS
ncbi:MAG: hypothetical protein DRQ89_14405 [Epsilonproteobacteria bacterium]|nr:MAG: hypothetical protein DRQ89_14405 [Campylobacterota bacterium]